MNNSDKCTCMSNDEFDRISSLPDEMLQHILSFLGIQEAVQTSLVSKRWVNLWTSLSHLNFDPHEFVSVDENLLRNKDRKRALDAKFKKFVEMLLSHREASFLDTFRIKILDRDNCFDLVRTCVDYARKFNPRVFSMEAPFLYKDISACIFSCESIEELCLRKKNYDYSQEIPEVVNLPCIRRLQLRQTRLDNRCITNLFSGCPKLEELSLENCFGEFSCIFTYQLKYLSLYGCSLILPTKKGNLCITSSLHEDTVETRIAIMHSSVQFILKFQGASVLNNPSSFMQNFIRHVDLDDNLLCLSGVTTLRLHRRNFKMLEKELQKLGEFHCLIELWLSGWCMTCNFNPVALFLQKSPNLQKLILCNYGRHCRGEKTGIDQIVDISMLLELSQCKNLKVVHIKLQRDYIRAHKVEEASLPLRKEFEKHNLEVILSQPDRPFWS